MKVKNAATTYVRRGKDLVRALWRVFPLKAGHAAADCERISPQHDEIRSGRRDQFLLKNIIFQRVVGQVAIRMESHFFHHPGSVSADGFYAER